MLVLAPLVKNVELAFAHSVSRGQTAEFRPSELLLLLRKEKLAKLSEYRLGFSSTYSSIASSEQSSPTFIYLFIFMYIYIYI